MFSLENKNALITGSGSGIGAAMAKVFAKAGAKVYVSDINPDAGMATLEQLVRLLVLPRLQQSLVRRTPP